MLQPDRLIFNMGIPLLVKTKTLYETAPSLLLWILNIAGHLRKQVIYINVRYLEKTALEHSGSYLSPGRQPVFSAAD